MEGKSIKIGCLENLSEDQIEELGPRPAVLGGWDYYLSGRVRRAAVYWNRLRGEVLANSGDYRPSVTAGEGGRLMAECDCPSRLPFCKHSIALLYLWANRPEEFTDLEGLTAALAGLAPDRLAALLGETLMAGDKGIDLLRREASQIIPTLNRALDVGLEGLIRDAAEMAGAGDFGGAAERLFWAMKFGPLLFHGRANRELLARIPVHYRDIVIAWNPESNVAGGCLLGLLELIIAASFSERPGGQAVSTENVLAELWERFAPRLGSFNRAIEARLRASVWNVESELALQARPELAGRKERLARLLATGLSFSRY